MTADQPTIVLVHGAWADATGFGDVIRALRQHGLAAIGAANPLRHLTGDAAYLASCSPLSTARSNRPRFPFFSGREQSPAIP